MEVALENVRGPRVNNGSQAPEMTQTLFSRRRNEQTGIFTEGNIITQPHKMGEENKSRTTRGLKQLEANQNITTCCSDITRKMRKLLLKNRMGGDKPKIQARGFPLWRAAGNRVGKGPEGETC